MSSSPKDKETKKNLLATPPHSTPAASGQPPSTPGAEDGGADAPYEVRTNDVHFNSRQGFPTNYIRTTKYTVITFLPLNLFEQFRRLSNFYFLVSMIVALIPGVSPVFPITSILPLLFVLTVGAIKDGVEDYDRYKADREANSMIVTVLREGVSMDIQTHQVSVGDIVFVEKGSVFPADLVLLSASSTDGNAYVETSNLDGETNLKLRKGHPDTMVYNTIESLTGLKATLQCEEPNEALYRFHGRLMFEDGKYIALSEKQILLRGSALRNTKWVYGLVVYAGTDTKMFKNLQKKIHKFSTIDKKLNRFVLALFVCQQLFCAFGAMLAVIFQENQSKDMWYLTGFNKFNGAQLFFTQYLTYFVLFNIMIPISLFVSLEIVRVCQARFMEWDPKMQARGKNMVAKTSSLNDELGRIQWVFSDKTGTLTENIMEFSKCSIEGHVHDEIATPGQLKTILTQSTHTSPASKETISMFLTALAVCHDVVPEYSEKTKKMNYEAQSPDEVALVDAAASNGFRLLARTNAGVEVDCLGNKVFFTVLATIEFNSDRKRQSVIVRRSDTNEVMCLCKGADSIMFPRLSHTLTPFAMRQVISNNLKDFSKEGLRTLVIAGRVMEEDEYMEWKQKFDEADASLEGRESKMEVVAEMVERDLCLYGATAIEDKLQPEVPETIKFLLDAGIVVWVLTGDKRETAVNIAYSSKLLDDTMDVLHIEAENSEKCGAQIQQYIEQFMPKVNPNAPPLPTKRLAMVIDGHSLQFALDDHKERFLKLALVCHAAICCRVTPLQKALCVRLVEKGTNKIGLSIGDGANDVSMIMEAKVGIGIIGVEGTQAARAADYAIPQFRHLKRLLCIHGRYSYLRSGDLIQYSFYKNLLLTWCQFFYIFFSGFSGQTLFDSWILLFYNMTFTALPPLFTGMFEKDLAEDLIESNPPVYKHTQLGRSCNVLTFTRWIVNSIVHAVIIYFCFLSFTASGSLFSDGQSFGIWTYGTLMAMIVITVALCKSGLETRCWTWLTHFGVWGSLLSFYFFLLAYSASPMVLDQANVYWVVYRIFSSGTCWFMLIWCTGICLLIDLAYKYIQWRFFPFDWQLLMELRKQFNDGKSDTKVFLGSEDSGTTL
eukprot:ANDGO_01127.mRNA.1 Phospholipid-transporting ATPase 3